MPVVAPAAARTSGAKASAGFLAGFAASLRSGWGKVTSTLRGNLGRLAPLFRRIPGLAVIGTVFAGAFAKLGPKMSGGLGKAFAALGRMLPALLKTVGRILVRGVFGWPALIATVLWMMLPQKVKSAITRALKDAGKWVLGALRATTGAVRDAGVWIAKTIAKGVTGAAKAVWGAVKSVGEKAWKALKDLASKFLGAGKAVIQAVAKGVTGAAKAVWDAIKKAASKALDALKGLVKGFAAAGKAIVMAIVNGVKSAAGAVVDAVKGVISGARDLLPFSEPRNRSSPLHGLGRSGEAVMGNLSSGVAKGAKGLKAQVTKALEAAYAPIRAAAQQKLAAMTAEDERNAPAPATRQQRETEIYGRISAARYATDDRGQLLNQPPPGVARIASRDEREAMAELADLRREFEREDLETAANINIKAMVPSDPKVLRQIQRSMGRSVKQARRRKPAKARRR